MAIVCELCGSSDLIKQEGSFVCQNCGMKYTLEEARKMVSGGTVDVSGSTVKIDGSGELANLFQLARRARQMENDENAAKYYDAILIKAPNSWEANFFTIYYTARTCKIGEISSAAEKVDNSIGPTLQLIRDHVTETQEKIDAIEEVRSNSVSISNMLVKAADNHFNNIPLSIRNDYIMENLLNKVKAWAIGVSFFGEFLDTFEGDREIMEKYGCEILKKRMLDGAHAEEADRITSYGLSDENVARYAAAVRIYEPDFNPPVYKKAPPKQQQQSSGGCYVATAVYGSYNCPQVWVLRRYRDFTLANTLAGRTFVRVYYAVSPTLVKWFGNTAWFKKLWKAPLDRMVTTLMSRGVESTPYQDREW